MKLSLCIPTNGVKEWVFPVLESIYCGEAGETDFQVVVTDNGRDKEFCEEMVRYAKKHTNLDYRQSDSPLFLNEIEAYRRAEGDFIRFINHRTKLLPGTLGQLMEFVEHYQTEKKEEKPVIYFANGMLRRQKECFVYDNFESFVTELSYWSSWSTGMGFWKEDFNQIPAGTVFNELFPHTTILFRETAKSRYIIDNRVLLQEIPAGNTPKGHYDLFYAFAVEYVAVLLELYRSGNISQESFLRLKQENLEFIADQYELFVLKGARCSYDLSGYRQSIQVFYSHRQVMDIIEKKTPARDGACLCREEDA